MTNVKPDIIPLVLNINITKHKNELEEFLQLKFMTMTYKLWLTI